LSYPLHSTTHILKALLFLGLGGFATFSSAYEAPEIALPKHRLDAHELAIIINDADPLSTRIGHYYQKARRIPPRNMIHISFKPGRTQLAEAEFLRIKAAVDEKTPADIQAYAITWAAPYRVDCMSITSAFSFGFDRAFCSKRRCAPTRQSPYFNRPSAQPFSAFGIRPTVSIAASSFEHAKALIDRGVSADNSAPSGTAYLLNTSDRARNVRSVNYAAIQRNMANWIDTRVLKTDALEDRNDVMFYFTGRKQVPYLDTLRFLPGAIADHLTSSGGRLSNSRQMSALRWLEAGATGSYGTVVEPCNLPGKFPNPGLVLDSYGSGRTLLEAYWQSVQQPGEGIFIGEPLSAPYDGYRLKVKEDRVLLETRILLPGLYQLSFATSPVGPYRVVPGFLKASYHQRTFILPKLNAKYMRLQRVTPNAESSAKTRKGGAVAHRAASPAPAAQ
jgi:uncharacterized protein (TIGR03790 family)